MIKLHTQLLYPEPDDSGTGSTTPSTYSLDSVPDEPEEPQGGEVQEQTPPASAAEEYTLTFDDADNINEGYRAVLTAAAKETEGLDAATASRLFHNLTGKLNTESQRIFLEDDAALKAEWGRDFEPRVKQTLSFMKRHFAQAGCTPEEAAMFENPRALRVMNKLMKVFSEGKAAGTGGAATAPTMSKEELIRAKTREIIEERKKAEPNQARLRELRREINKAVGLSV